MKRKQSYTHTPRGEARQTRFLNLVRRWCAVFDERRQTREWCANCFKMRWYPDHYAGAVKLPFQGCDGCSEMWDCEEEFRRFFAEEARDDVQ